MARISGVTIPDNKQIHVALTYVYGLGPKSSVDIVTAAKVEPTVRVKDLTDAEISRIPYTITIGDKEEKANTLAIRERGKKPQFGVKPDKFIMMLKEKIEKRE